MAPTTLLPDRTYLAISSSLDPESLSASLQGLPVKLQYRGPVGELEGEHIFEVEGSGGAIAPTSEEWTKRSEDVVQNVKRAQGVTGVKALVAKQRTKRDEF